MVDGGGLENRWAVNSVPWVRIPPSPIRLDGKAYAVRIARKQKSECQYTSGFRKCRLEDMNPSVRRQSSARLFPHSRPYK